MEKFTIVLLLPIASLIVAPRTTTATNVDTTKCGRPSVPMRVNLKPPSHGQRIVGGLEARPGSHPWIISLKVGGGHVCGGTLIRVANEEATDIVITAAHCVVNIETMSLKPASSMSVRAGAHDISIYSLDRQGEQVAGVLSIHVHESYVPAYKWNDIAVLRLSKPIYFNSNVQPACMPSMPEVKSGAEVIVAGWGYLQHNAKRVSNVLMQVGLMVADDGYCQDIHTQRRTWTHMETMLCAGRYEGGQDSCQGDSGGPLVSKENNVYVLRGVVSWGPECGLPKVPGIYTRLLAYVGWIREKVHEYSGVAKGKVSAQVPSSQRPTSPLRPPQFAGRPTSPPRPQQRPQKFPRPTTPPRPQQGTRPTSPTRPPRPQQVQRPQQVPRPQQRPRPQQVPRPQQRPSLQSPLLRPPQPLARPPQFSSPSPLLRPSLSMRPTANPILTRPTSLRPALYVPPSQRPGQRPTLQRPYTFNYPMESPRRKPVVSHKPGQVIVDVDALMGHMGWRKGEEKAVPGSSEVGDDSNNDTS